MSRLAVGQHQKYQQTDSDHRAYRQCWPILNGLDSTGKFTSHQVLKYSRPYIMLVFWMFNIKILPKILKLRKQNIGRKYFGVTISSLGSKVETRVGKTAMVIVKVATRQTASTQTV